jgi:hypothetical protein
LRRPERPRSSTGRMMKAKLREAYKELDMTQEQTQSATEPLRIDIVSDVV